MISNRLTTRTGASVPSTTTIPPTTVALPAAVPVRAQGPLQVKDGFESAPATKASAKSAVKTDALATSGLKKDDAKLLELKANLKAAQKSGGDVKGAYQALAAYEFGVDPKLINVVTGWDQTDASKINVMIPNRDNKAGTTSGWTVPEKKDRGATFEQGRDVKPTIVINAKVLEEKEPARAQKVLFHEGLHLAHAKLAASAFEDFKKLGKKGEKFESWVDRQKTFTPAEKKLIKEENTGTTTNNTEAVAHTEAFIASFQKLEHHATKNERLANEGAELLDLVDQNPSDEVKTQERKSLKKFYDSLPTDADKKALLDTLSDLPSNWLTTPDPLK